MEDRESSRSHGGGLRLASGEMNLHAIFRRKQPNWAVASTRPAVKPAVACERVMLEAQRVAQQVARSRATLQG
jgi:hypothetical protein